MPRISLKQRFGIAVLACVRTMSLTVLVPVICACTLA
jgi:hypothetical protein